MSLFSNMQSELLKEGRQLLSDLKRIIIETIEPVIVPTKTEDQAGGLWGEALPPVDFKGYMLDLQDGLKLIESVVFYRQLLREEKPLPDYKLHLWYCDYVFYQKMNDIYNKYHECDKDKPDVKELEKIIDSRLQKLIETAFENKLEHDLVSLVEIFKSLYLSEEHIPDLSFDVFSFLRICELYEELIE